jgi:hypothetical protein
MKIALQFLLTIGFAINAAATTMPCSPVPGADQIWPRASVHWVFVGEFHGSNETPAAFYDLICDAIAHGKHVTVALERTTDEQAAIDKVITSRDLAAAKESLLRLHGWKEVMDGRASEAMLRLLLSLRELHSHHRHLKVVAFDAPYTGGAREREKAMSEALLALRPTSPDDLVLILTGNLHAMQATKRGYNLAAMYLPRKETLSLEVTDRGGETWSESLEDGCGPQKGGAEDKDASRPYGIFLDPGLAPFGKVDGILSLGAALTPSAPAAGEPSAIPECRAKFLSQHQAAPKNQ